MASWCQADTEGLGDTMTWAELLNFCTAIRLPVPPALLKAAWADAPGHTLDRQHQLDTRAPSGTGTQWHHEHKETRIHTNFHFSALDLLLEGFLPVFAGLAVMKTPDPIQERICLAQQTKRSSVATPSMYTHPNHIYN